MATVGLFYGTQTGNTETAAEAIQNAFGEGVVELFDIADTDVSELEKFDNIIIGCPTWNIGEMQSDWDAVYEELDSLDLSGKKVAYFGVGDQIGYADNFQDAMGMLEEKISSLGAKTVGEWSTEGYEHSESKAEKNGKFVGLALDEDNQADLTESRILSWVQQIKQAFGV